MININIFKKRATRMILTLMTTASFLLSCMSAGSPFKVEHEEGQSLIKTKPRYNYLLLPIEEGCNESRLEIVVNNNVEQQLNVRLATTRIDYFVPLDLSTYRNKDVVLRTNLSGTAICWDSLQASDTFDTTNREPFRPAYHFSPQYGWMNDPNGMVYKDGEYHLFYQYNPYGSMWGNMHWGHAVSKDLVDWEHLPVAIAPDSLGTIFSGSAVVDKDNTAGFGAGAIVALYTSAGERQTQSMAYSLDNGRSFVKYDGNPVITADIPDFRDPKVFWHEATGKWVLILAAGQEMQIFSSPNLKEWTYESSFGAGEGAHGGVWECPDLIELNVDESGEKRWVLICNINPGGPFGGSAAQYFVGSFDGRRFVNQSPATTKWMDWGKDHYATVTWSNAPSNRSIAIAWMSNWQYANNVPTKQFRSANSVPRDLSLYTHQGETYLRNAPSIELNSLRGEPETQPPFKVDRTHNIDKLLSNNTGAYEIEMSITNHDAEVIGFRLFNQKGELLDCYYNLLEKKFYMDRNASGLTGFSHEFPAVTAAPITGTGEMKLRIFVDKCSIEAFGDDGRFVMTNLVFPSEPYNRISFYGKGGTYSVSSFTIYPLATK